MEKKTEKNSESNLEISTENNSENKLETKQLESTSFSYRCSKDNKIIIYWHDVQIKILSDRNAEKLLEKLNNADSKELQILLSKATHNLKRKKDGDTETIVIRGVHHTRTIL